MSEKSTLIQFEDLLSQLSEFVSQNSDDFLVIDDRLHDEIPHQTVSQFFEDPSNVMHEVRKRIKELDS